MKKIRFLIVIFALLFATFAVIGCVNDDSSSTGGDTGSSEQPVEKLVLGVAYGGDEAADNEIVIDYKNVAGGISFYSIKGDAHETVTLALTEIKVSDEVLDGDDYEYDGGILDFTPEYLKTLTLNEKYAVTAVFGEEKAEFGLTMTDEEAPAVVFVTEGIVKKVYVAGSSVTLPEVTKAASSVQNVMVEYSLKDAAGEDCSYENNEYAATATGRYTYTAVIYKNGVKTSEKAVSFLVIDPAETNFADKDVVSVLGGKYNEEKGAAEFKGTNTLSDITVNTKYTRVRLSYSGEGTVSFDGTETALVSTDKFAVARFTVKDFNTIVITSENGLLTDSLTVSEISAFSEEDIAEYNFASRENAGYWSFNPTYGTPSYDEEKGGIVFPANGNSWVYALREGIMKTAYDAGYKYLLVTYTGKGSTRIFNNASENGDWGGYAKDFSNAVTPTSFAFNLEAVSRKTAMDETAGVSIIVNDVDFVLTEFRFCKEKPEVGENYTDKNLAAKEYFEKWDVDGGCSMTYDEEEQALVLAANGNSGTFSFRNGAVLQAKESGYNAVKFTVKGGQGSARVFLNNNWGSEAVYNFSSSSEYVTFTVMMDEVDVTDASGITLLASEAAGGEAVTVKEIKFAYVEIEDLSDKNLAAKEYLDRWTFNADYCSMTYDEEEQALVLAANGNAETYTFRENALKKAKENGYNGVKFTVKGGSGSARVFLNNTWSTDEFFNFTASESYLTFTLPIAYMTFTKEAGITVLASEANGGANVYVKEIVFVKEEISDEVKAIIDSNLVSEENMSKWVGDGTVEYDAEAGAMKFTFEAKKGRYFNLEKLWYYAKLLGKTKLVWTYADGYTDMNNDRLRIYSSTDLTVEPSVNVNGQGQKVDGGRAVLIETSKAGNEEFLAIYKNKVSSTCNYILISDIHFE